MQSSSLKEVVERHRKRIIQLRDVSGVGVGVSPKDPSKPCILVYVTTNDWPEGLEREIDGYDVELAETTGFRTF
jgi:hypothetical protein